MKVIKLNFLEKKNVSYKICNCLDFWLSQTTCNLLSLITFKSVAILPINALKQQLKNSPNLPAIIYKVLSNCAACILYNCKNEKQEGKLHPLSKNETPLITYHIDPLGPLQSTSKHYKYIFCVSLMPLHSLCGCNPVKV